MANNIITTYIFTIMYMHTYNEFTEMFHVRLHLLWMSQDYNFTYCCYTFKILLFYGLLPPLLHYFFFFLNHHMIFIILFHKYSKNDFSQNWKISLVLKNCVKHCSATWELSIITMIKLNMRQLTAVFYINAMCNVYVMCDLSSHISNLQIIVNL